MTMLVAENISVAKGGRTILRDVSLQAHAGEFIAVIGPNGAGKSTLLSALAGLLKPDSGKVLLDAKALNKVSLEQLAVRRAYLRILRRYRSRRGVQPRPGAAAGRCRSARRRQA